MALILGDMENLVLENILFNIIFLTQWNVIYNLPVNIMELLTLCPHISTK